MEVALEHNLNDIELFLFDMDGTVNIENRLIDGALELFEGLENDNKKYVFLTNNSSQSGESYVKKMRNLGLNCSIDNIFSAGMAMAEFLVRRRKKKKVYLVGTKSYYDELSDYGIELVDDDPDIVVVGFDKELTYEKLEKACKFISNGAEYLATNLDLVCPVSDGRFIPDCGSICQIISRSTNKEPVYIGKPDRKMVDMVALKNKITNEKTAVIGDRLYTDIQVGINAGALSILVLTGETKKEQLKNFNPQPDKVFKSVKNIAMELGYI